MGEAILTRSGAAGEIIQAPAIVAGYCSMLFILKDPSGAPIPNWPVNCKDGSIILPMKKAKLFSCVIQDLLIIV